MNYRGKKMWERVWEPLKSKNSSEQRWGSGRGGLSQKENMGNFSLEEFLPQKECCGEWSPLHLICFALTGSVEELVPHQIRVVCCHADGTCQEEQSQGRFFSCTHCQYDCLPKFPRIPYPSKSYARPLSLRIVSTIPNYGPSRLSLAGRGRKSSMTLTTTMT